MSLKLLFRYQVLITFYEPHHEKTGILHMRKQRRRSAVTAKLISAFVFATRIVQSLFYLNPKFQASSHLVRLYIPVCVGPGRKPRRAVFSQRGSYNADLAASFDVNILRFKDVSQIIHAFLILESFLLIRDAKTKLN